MLIDVCGSVQYLQNDLFKTAKLQNISELCNGENQFFAVPSISAFLLDVTGQ